jgi:hypothetical protein
MFTVLRVESTRSTVNIRFERETLDRNANEEVVNLRRNWITSFIRQSQQSQHHPYKCTFSV